MTSHEERHREEAVRHTEDVAQQHEEQLAASEKIALASLAAQREREKFVRRTLVVVVLAVLVVVGMQLGTGFLFSQEDTITATEKAFRDHKEQNRIALKELRGQIDTLVKNHETETSTALEDALRRRNRQLIRFIRRMGLEPPATGSGGGTGGGAGGNANGGGRRRRNPTPPGQNPPGPPPPDCIDVNLLPDCLEDPT